jgi:hypothetical protein
VSIVISAHAEPPRTSMLRHDLIVTPDLIRGPRLRLNNAGWGRRIVDAGSSPA